MNLALIITGMMVFVEVFISPEMAARIRSTSKVCSAW